MKQTRFTSAALVAVLLSFTIPLYAQEPRRITILYDAFGPPSALVKDWGFAVFLDRFKERFDRTGLGAVVALP